MITVGRVLGLLAMLAALFAGSVPAQEYPGKPVKLVVPFPPGSSTDLMARMLAEHLTGALKQPAVVENRPGGNAMIGTQAVARSAPDGYNLLIGVPSLATFKVFFKSPAVDTERDLAPISLIMVSPYVLATNATLPVNTLGEFIAYAKANPGKVKTGGYGGQYLATEYFKQTAGIDLYNIGYKGDVQAVQALVANDIQFLFTVPINLRAHVDAGKVRVLSTSTTSIRSPGMPNVQTMGEAGLPGFDVSIAFGLLAPAGTPIEIRRKLGSEVAAFVRKPDVIGRLKAFGFEPLSGTPEEYAKLLSDDIRRWLEIAKRLPIEAE